jgi:hypothetical protein
MSDGVAWTGTPLEDEEKKKRRQSKGMDHLKWRASDDNPRRMIVESSTYTPKTVRDTMRYFQDSVSKDASEYKRTTIELMSDYLDRLYNASSESGPAARHTAGLKIAQLESVIEQISQGKYSMRPNPPETAWWLLVLDDKPPDFQDPDDLSQGGMGQSGAEHPYDEFFDFDSAEGELGMSSKG